MTKDQAVKKSDLLAEQLRKHCAAHELEVFTFLEAGLKGETKCVGHFTGAMVQALQFELLTQFPQLIIPMLKEYEKVLAEARAKATSPSPSGSALVAADGSPLASPGSPSPAPLSVAERTTPSEPVSAEGAEAVPLHR